MPLGTSPPPSYEPAPPAFGEIEAWGEVEQASSETEPFLPGRQVKQAWYRKHQTCIAVILLFTAAMLGSWVLAVNSTNRNLVQWEKELSTRKAQEKIRELEWETQRAEKQAQEHAREVEWDHQMQQTREAERVRESEWEKQVAERCEQEHMREMEWERQFEEAHEQERARELEWAREMEQRRDDERARRQSWERDLQRSRDEWKRELATQKALERRRQQAWDRKMEENREAERERERQWHLDQAERERLGLYWDHPVASRCSAHGVRDYRARLLNALPYHYNWLEPCMEIPIAIRGQAHNATRCEQIGDEIWGHWSIGGDSLCSPFFEDWRDNGCIAPGSQRRLASARLDYIPNGESGLELCSSTPLRFWDRSFAHPDTCAQHGNDVWGYWEVNDGAC